MIAEDPNFGCVSTHSWDQWSTAWAALSPAVLASYTEQANATKAIAAGNRVFPLADQAPAEQTLVAVPIADRSSVALASMGGDAAVLAAYFRGDSPTATVASSDAISPAVFAKLVLDTKKADVLDAIVPYVRKVCATVTIRFRIRC